MNVSNIKEKRSCGNCLNLSKNDNCFIHHCKIEDKAVMSCGSHEYNFSTTLQKTEEVISSEKLLIEMCHAVANRHQYYLDGEIICEYCGSIKTAGKIIHRPDCIVLRAKRTIKIKRGGY